MPFIERPKFANPLPGVPSIESPFFQSIFENEDEAIRKIALQLLKNGFAVIDFPVSNFDLVAEATKK